jgi:glycosyltransferase involved in cell wall biosynthesis
MASGCAVVATDIGALASDVLENGHTGFLVPPKNSDAIAEKILMLIEDSILCKKMVSAGLIASKKFDVNYTVKKIEQCYHELLRFRD